MKRHSTLIALFAALALLRGSCAVAQEPERDDTFRVTDASAMYLPSEWGFMHMRGTHLGETVNAVQETIDPDTGAPIHVTSISSGQIRLTYYDTLEGTLDKNDAHVAIVYTTDAESTRERMGFELDILVRGVTWVACSETIGRGPEDEAGVAAALKRFILDCAERETRIGERLSGVKDFYAFREQLRARGGYVHLAFGGPDAEKSDDSSRLAGNEIGGVVKIRYLTLESWPAEVETTSVALLPMPAPRASRRDGLSKARERLAAELMKTLGERVKGYIVSSDTFGSSARKSLLAYSDPTARIFMGRPWLSRSLSIFGALALVAAVAFVVLRVTRMRDVVVPMKRLQPDID